MQVGPFWKVSDILLGVRQGILLSSPGNYTIPVPYTVTITANGDVGAMSRWEWNGATKPDQAGAKEVRRSPLNYCAHRSCESDHKMSAVTHLLDEALHLHGTA